MPKPLPALALLVLLLSAPRAHALPINFGNAGVATAAHGVYMVHPATTLDGRSSSVWSSLEVGLGGSMSVGVDTLYLLVPSRQDFGTTFAGLNFGAKPTSWLSLSLNPRFGHATGGFGRQQAALRAHADFRLHDTLSLYTMPAYYHPLDDASAPALRFNLALEHRPMPAVCTMLEVFMGAPSWEFGTATALGIAPGVTAPLGPASCKLSVRIPLVPASGVASLEAPTAVLGVGSVW